MSLSFLSRFWVATLAGSTALSGALLTAAGPLEWEDDRGTLPPDYDQGLVDEDPPYSHRHGARAPAAWTRESGEIPTLWDSLNRLQTRGDILIGSDRDFNPEHGIRSGRGTWEEPYVISGWAVDRLVIRDTDAYVKIRENYIREVVVLNWNGDRVYVHHNFAKDLRVNQNVKRTGDATAGLIEHNRFDSVGQLRHFDGEFAHNEVGADAPIASPFANPVAVNFDGFNGAHFHHNTIYGILDVKLHGHHHGSAFGAPSHVHGGPMNTSAHEPLVNHSLRYHEVLVESNHITSYTSYALRYYDRGHAGDDRTATSETEKNLTLPHQHFTRVRFVGNDVVGGGILIDVMNAEDELHTIPSHAWVFLEGNHVTLASGPHETPIVPGIQPYPSGGIVAQIGRWVDLDVDGNRIESRLLAAPLAELETAGIRLRDFDNATINIENNTVSNTTYGIWARVLSETTRWRLVANQVSATQAAVYYDSTVAQPPGP